MPKYAVLLRYEVFSGLIVEAENQDEAVVRATEYEAALNDSAENTPIIDSYLRSWGDGEATCEAADDDDEAADLLDEWADDIGLDVDDDYDAEADDYLNDEAFDEDDGDEDDSDEEKRN